MALNKVQPHIPDLVIQQIIRLLPTKAAVRMSFLSRQWEEVLSSVPILDFDECGEQPHNSDRNDFQQQHRKFINNILKRYLERCDKNQHKQVLEKFRLRMMYLSEDTAIVDRLLSFSFERGVKELEISLRVSKSHWARGGINSYYCFCLSPSTLANAKSITTLKLEYMRIKEVDLQCDHMNLPKSTTLLPSLKTMCLKNVHFNFLYYLIRECPSIEHLSLISCSFDKPVVLVFTSSLKFLEVKHCKAGSNIHVHDEAKTLESFTFVSSRMEGIVLNNTDNLKHINIHARYLKDLIVHGCHSSVKAIINTPNLLHFDFYGYFMKSKVSVRAPHLSSARIILREIWEEEQTSNWSWEHYSALRVFLKVFGCSRNISLFTRDFKALTFPAIFRRTFSSSKPLPRLAQLMLTMPNPPTEVGDVPDDFRDSLTWMAPSSRLELVRMDRIPALIRYI